MTITTDFLIFSLCACIEKYALLTQLRLFFPCFCFSPWSLTLLHPSISICTHVHSHIPFFYQSRKTWCPGKFPRPYHHKNTLQYSFFTLSTLFLHPPMSPVPHRTHPHPSSPVSTRLYPFTSLIIIYTCIIQSKNSIQLI